MQFLFNKVCSLSTKILGFRLMFFLLVYILYTKQSTPVHMFLQSVHILLYMGSFDCDFSTSRL